MDKVVKIYPVPAAEKKFFTREQAESFRARWMALAKEMQEYNCPFMVIGSLYALDADGGNKSHNFFASGGALQYGHSLFDQIVAGVKLNHERLTDEVHAKFPHTRPKPPVSA